MIVVLLLIIYYSMGLMLMSTAERLASRASPLGSITFLCVSFMWPLVLLVVAAEIARDRRN